MKATIQPPRPPSRSVRAGAERTCGPSREVLLLFTKFPEPGRAKTRLIPALGNDGAARLQRAMTEHVLARVRPLVARQRVALEIRYAAGTHGEMCQWLGPELRQVAQGEGDLGERLSRAFEWHFASGATSVVAIGADCPGVDEQILRQAFTALHSKPVVFGPAVDGGYYLVGLRRSAPALFRSIAWGTSQVLAQSLAAARAAVGEAALLPPLQDVDVAEDLSVWEACRRGRQTVSVVIPALNEAGQIAATLERVKAAQPKEILVVDGGSTDATARIASESGAVVLASPPGRARQMNTGAEAAAGAVLLFLHADTWPPEDCIALAAEALDRGGVVGGAFSFALRERMRGGRLVEWLTNARSRTGRLPYGDQGLFVRRELFEALGGFPPWPVLEDLELLHRLKRIGRVVTLRPSVLTSARRWQQGGLLRTFARHQLILLGYAAGLSPHALARLR